MLSKIKLLIFQILDPEFNMVEVFLVIHANTRSGLLTQLKPTVVLDRTVLSVTRRNSLMPPRKSGPPRPGDSTKPSRLGDIR